MLLIIYVDDSQEIINMDCVSHIEYYSEEFDRSMKTTTFYGIDGKAVFCLDQGEKEHNEMMDKIIKGQLSGEGVVYI